MRVVQFSGGRDNMKLYKFETITCGACKMMANVMAQIKDLPPVELVDCEEQPDVAGDFGVFQVPTIVLVDDNNKEVKRHTGFMPKAQFEKWVKGDE